MLMCDSLGNYMVSTPLLTMLRAQFTPNKLAVIVPGHRIREMLVADKRLDEWHLIETMRMADRFDLVVNLDLDERLMRIASNIGDRVIGPCVGLSCPDDTRGRLAQVRDWMAIDLTKRFPFLDSGFIGEVFCRLAYLEGEVPQCRAPVEPCDVQIPRVLISASASREDKIWPLAKWSELVRQFDSVGIVGATSGQYFGSEIEDALAKDCHDFRGRLTLPQVNDALAKAELVVSIDNGIMHLAASNGVKTVGLFRHGFDRLWKQPRSNLRAVVATEYGSVAEIEIGAILRVIHEID